VLGEEPLKVFKTFMPLIFNIKKMLKGCLKENGQKLLGFCQ
jgi:hypothetical protein